MNRFFYSVFSSGRKSIYSTSASYSHLCRSFMYVPGDKSKMLNKILSLNNLESPDITVFDLEDGVYLNNKDLARNNIFTIFKSDTLKSNADICICVRINSISFKDIFEKDVEVVSEILKVSNYDYPKMICLPKVDNNNDLIWLDQTLKNKIDVTKLKNPIELCILIESCLAISTLNELCQNSVAKSYSCFKLNHAVFGSDDYCASMGVSRTPSNTEVLYARQHFTTVMKAYKISPIDMVDIDIHNLQALEENCKFGANIGFVGKQVIHPKQLPIVNKCFSPTEADIKWATELMKEYEIQKNQNAGAFTFMGRMIDRPTILIAQNVVDTINMMNKKEK